LRKAYQSFSPLLTQWSHLKSIHIPQVKEELRVLGIAAYKTPDGYIVVGAVYRGNNTLDGVLYEAGGGDLVDIISGMLRGSKHYGQLRLILIDESRLPKPVDPERLWLKTEKPVIILSTAAAFDPRFMFQYFDKVVYAAGIDEASTRRVLDKVDGGSGSEAIRVANIILEALSHLHNV